MGLSVPHRKHITSLLRAKQVNAIYRFVTMVYYYNYHKVGHYPSSCPLFKSQLNSQETHYISLWAQQIIASYRCMTMVYTYHNSQNYPLSCPLFKKHNVSETGFCLRVKRTQMGPTERSNLLSPDTSNNTNRVSKANRTQTLFNGLCSMIQSNLYLEVKWKYLLESRNWLYGLKLKYVIILWQTGRKLLCKKFWYSVMIQLTLK
jgi:hypothetical protein